MDIIRVPFGYLLDWLYQFTSNYGLSLILFALIVRIVLLPVNAKSKKSMMKMTRLQPRIQEIQRKYADDRVKQNEAMQKLQREEGVNMGCGGCLWSLVPLLLLIPLFTVIRSPMQYMFHESSATVNAILKLMKEVDPSVLAGNAGYKEMAAVAHIRDFADLIREAGIQVSDRTLDGLNFSFLGINLSQIPSWQIWAWKRYDWNAFGGLLIPVCSAGSQVLQMWLSQRSNNSLVTDKNGLEDKETAAKSQTAKQGKTMMYVMPFMSLAFGFMVPAALSLYWFVGGVFSMVENHIMTNHYRKIYDAEDAIRLQKYQEQLAIEEEKERIRAEKRAANPEGQTQNTSKKKLQQKQKAEEEAARAAAAKEYAAKKGVVFEEASEETQTLSGVADRPFCKGRAYDPNRYNSTEE